MAEAAVAKKKSSWRALGLALTNRKTGFMLIFGFGAGLPYALITGTIFAWFTAEEINTATIGVFSLVGLSYAFKFLWSPALDRINLGGLSRLGKRKQWIIPAQLVLGLSIIVLSFLDPSRQLGYFALLAALGAFVSATQDVVIDAWRVEVADEVATIDILSSVYQMGYRLASLMGGAIALIMAGKYGWPWVFFWLGCSLFVIALAGLFAPDSDADAMRSAEGADPVAFLNEPGQTDRQTRALALRWVGILWLWAIVVIVLFMVRSLGGFVPTIDIPIGGGVTFHPSWALGMFAPGENGLPDSKEFTLYMGPFIVLATVIIPAAIAGWLEAARLAGRHVVPAAGARSTPPVGNRAMDHLYRALILPLTELVGRLGWAMILAMALVLTYRITDSIWGSFAYPFYLGELKYTLDEVAFASKIFGVGAVVLGLALGGLLLTTIGRMTTLLIGAILAALTNLLYADLAVGGLRMAAVSDAVGFTSLVESFGGTEKLAKLMIVIGGENLAVGIAGAAFVAWLSSIVSKQYSAVQYALLSSLTMLVGTLGRGALGQLIEERGYYYVFILTTLIGGVAVLLVLAEWWRESRYGARSGVVTPDAVGQPAE